MRTLDRFISENANPFERVNPKMRCELYTQEVVEGVESKLTGRGEVYLNEASQLIQKIFEQHDYNNYTKFITLGYKRKSIELQRITPISLEISLKYGNRTVKENINLSPQHKLYLLRILERYWKEDVSSYPIFTPSLTVSLVVTLILAALTRILDIKLFNTQEIFLMSLFTAVALMVIMRMVRSGVRGLLTDEVFVSRARIYTGTEAQIASLAQLFYATALFTMVVLSWFLLFSLSRN